MTLHTTIKLLGAVVLLLPGTHGAGIRAASTATAASAPWATAWPMVGHDPQRTNRSAMPGPAQPHLRWSYPGAWDAPLIGPDGTLYTWGTHGVLDLTAAGRRRWIAPAAEYLGGPPALGADGLLRVNGQLPNVAGAITPAAEPHMSIVALSPHGRPRWQIRALPWATVPRSVPFSKGVAPLVSAANLLYMPFVGPVYRPGQNDGVELISPRGVPLRRLLPGWSGPIALAPNGTIYEVGGDTQGHEAILAATAQGAIRWRHAVSYDQWGAVLVGRAGAVYASDGAGAGLDERGEVVAYTPAGRLRWRLPTRGGSAALAERADGTLLLATSAGLLAVAPDGARRWYRPLGAAAGTVEATPTLVVDAAGRAYVATAAGTVRAFAPDGTSLWTLPAGGPSHSGVAPGLALGPTGTLAVTGTDGVLRLYS